MGRLMNGVTTAMIIDHIQIGVHGGSGQVTANAVRNTARNARAVNEKLRIIAPSQ